MDRIQSKWVVANLEVRSQKNTYQIKGAPTPCFHRKANTMLITE